MYYLDCLKSDKLLDPDDIEMWLSWLSDSTVKALFQKRKT